MRSCLYEGVVTHRRRTPVRHSFRSRLWMALLDLEEVDAWAETGRLISDRKYAPSSFLPSDHLFDREQSLAGEVRGIVARATGDAPSGPVRLLTQLRTFGLYFSPLNLFFLYGESDDQPDCVVAEVNNTPWGERCCYVLDVRRSPVQGGVMRFRHGKDMHVSPFMPMDLTYVWRISVPDDRLSVGLACERESSQLFQAALVLSRTELSKANLRRAALLQPAVGAQTIVSIYFQALRLWWKRCPYYPHPNSQPTPDRTSPQRF